MTAFIFQGASSVCFHEFMQQSLYHPLHGYYNQPTVRQGAIGDYITSPSMSNLFAHCLANNLEPLLVKNPDWSIAEYGPGQCDLAVDLLKALHKKNLKLNRYYLIDKSVKMRELQQEKIQNQCESEARKSFHWRSELPENFNGIVIANEVLDALPVHLLETDSDQKLYGLHVTIDQQNLCFRRCDPDATLLQLLQSRKIPLYPNYRYEISSDIPSFIQEVSTSLSRGICLFFDYGYSRQHYYHPQRRNGTLTSFYRHQQTEHILYQPGKQDISVHVDFTLVAESAHAAGLTLYGFTNQEQFLLASNLGGVLFNQKDQLSQNAYVNLRKSAHVLTSPLEMGALVKVIALQKNVLPMASLCGFQFGSMRL